MTPGDAARVLAKAAAYDRRTIGEADALAWAEALDHASLADCLTAVTRHYAATREWIMPSDVLAIVRTIHNDRTPSSGTLAIEGPPPVPLRDRSADIQALVAGVIDALPTTESDRIHARAQAVARRTKGRPDTTRKSKPKRQPAKDWPDPQTDDIAAMATRYLLDGHEPAAVAERLCVSRRWCANTARRFTTAAESKGAA